MTYTCGQCQKEVEHIFWFLWKDCCADCKEIAEAAIKQYEEECNKLFERHDEERGALSNKRQLWLNKWISGGGWAEEIP